VTKNENYKKFKMADDRHVMLKTTLGHKRAVACPINFQFTFTRGKNDAGIGHVTQTANFENSR